MGFANYDPNIAPTCSEAGECSRHHIHEDECSLNIWPLAKRPCLFLSTLRFFNNCLLFSSVWSDSPGKSVWAGRDPACLLHHSHHEWTGSSRCFRCVLHDLRSSQYVLTQLNFLNSDSGTHDLNCLTVPEGGSALQDSAFGYFITACVVILLAIMSYMALPRMVMF